MPHRAYLFSLRIGHALRESILQERYSVRRFQKDVLAGLTVGVIAIPLAMALAIASGVAPQYGLYTAAIGGFFIALTGGSRLSVSGPTAAFVVILYPITQKYGLSGLLMASFMAGFILLALAFFRLGRLIEYIPQPVTLGFTGGIGVVIATLQIKDFLGLPLEEMPEHYLGKLGMLAGALGQTQWPSLLVAAITLAAMLSWSRLKTAIPPHLPALLLGSLVAFGLNHHGYLVDTISSRFTYMTAEGVLAHGIPAIAPDFEWPWARADASNHSLNLGWSSLRDLLPSAFAIAMLGAIESLLCAVVLDGMTGKRHSANSELLGQGIGNIIAPFFGGIAATAAIARSAANAKAGAESPIASMIHALVVGLGLLLLAPLLGYLPMPAMAALLMVVAWNMSEAHKGIALFKTSQASDRWVLVCCFSLTVLFDMVIAITAGILLAALLFMKEMADMTRVVEITDDRQPMPKHWRIFKITGPLFFAAADKVFAELTLHSQKNQGVIVCLEAVNLLDAGGVAALNKLISHCVKAQSQLILTDVQMQPMNSLAKNHIVPIEGVFTLYPTLEQAVQSIERHSPQR